MPAPLGAVPGRAAAGGGRGGSVPPPGPPREEAAATGSRSGVALPAGALGVSAGRGSRRRWLLPGAGRGGVGGGSVGYRSGGGRWSPPPGRSGAGQGEQPAPLPLHPVAGRARRRWGCSASPRALRRAPGRLSALSAPPRCAPLPSLLRGSAAAARSARGCVAVRTSGRRILVRGWT